MKKIFLLFLLLLFITGCKASNTIYYDLFIASIGFEKNNDEFTAYFYLPSSLDVGSTKQDATKYPSEVAEINDSSISGLFYKLEASTYLNMNLKHISSIVLDKSFLNDKDIDELISYIKNSKNFDFNFYIFITEDDIREIYNVKNPNNESVILTVLCDPIANSIVYKTIKPIHFLNFVRDYYDNKTIGLTILNRNSVWSENNDSIYCNGVCYIKNMFGSKLFYDTCFSYLYNHDYLYYSSEDTSIIFNNYSICYNEFNIKVKTKYNVLYSLENNYNIEKIIKDAIYASINLLYENKFIEFKNDINIDIKLIN